MPKIRDERNLATTKCIVCLGPAEILGGHILKGDEKVLVGWCEKHADNSVSPNLMRRVGCYGGWHPRYGLTDDFWGSRREIDHA